MLEFGVGRTKPSAVPAGVWQLPELRCAWSGLQTQPKFRVLTTHAPCLIPSAPSLPVVESVNLNRRIAMAMPYASAFEESALPR